MTLVLNIQHMVLLGLLSAGLHWLFARAEITRFAWSRARGWVDKLLRCPACSGYWLGLLWYELGVRAVSVESHAGGLACNGLIAMVLTPVVEAVVLWGLEHSAVAEPDCPLCASTGAPWPPAGVPHEHCERCRAPYLPGAVEPHVCVRAPA